MKTQTTVKPTQEEKEQYFAAHWGQKIGIMHTYNSRGYINISYLAQVTALELTSLADITDEDAIEVAKLNADIDEYLPGMGDERAMRYGRNNIYFLSLRTETSDFLRSKGYALPFRNYSLQDLIDLGWLKLRQKGGESNE